MRKSSSLLSGTQAPHGMHLPHFGYQFPLQWAPKLPQIIAISVILVGRLEII